MQPLRPNITPTNQTSQSKYFDEVDDIVKVFVEGAWTGLEKYGGMRNMKCDLKQACDVFKVGRYDVYILTKDMLYHSRCQH